MSRTASLPVAVYQPAAGGLDPSQRLAALERVLMGSGRPKPRLLVCPELFMSGYDVGAALERRAEAVDGPFAKAVARLARKHRQAILYGYPETAMGRRYNSAACFGPDGRLLANHRKLALPPGMEARYFQPGKDLTFFSLGGFRLALLVCYDAEFPELVRAVAQAGAQVVVVPTALRDCWSSVARRMMPTRAFENGVYLLYANHAGREGGMSYLGASCILGPDGEDLARAGAGEELLQASLDLPRLRKAQARLPYLDDLAGLRPVARRTARRG